MDSKRLLLPKTSDTQKHGNSNASNCRQPLSEWSTQLQTAMKRLQYLRTAHFSTRASRVLAAIGAVLLSGCASGPVLTELQPAPEGSAQIYVYRTLRAFQNTMPKKIAIDGEQSRNLQNGAWMRVLVTPGSHTIAITHHLSTLECRPVTVRLGAGQVAFIETWTATAGYPQMVVSCLAEARSADVATSAMRGLRAAE